MPDENTATEANDVHLSRLELIWKVLVFQFKLALDGIRDVLLVPLSIISGILGLVAGGGLDNVRAKQQEKSDT